MSRFFKAGYLIHYGIKGQKHGLRRFQNEDGTLTEAGKDRYGIGSALANAGLKMLENAISKKYAQRDQNNASTRGISRSYKYNSKEGMHTILKNEAANKKIIGQVKNLQKAKDFISKFV